MVNEGSSVKTINNWFFGGIMIAATFMVKASENSSMVDVNPNGATEISAQLSSGNIQVTILTHEVAIKEARRGGSSGVNANCTFSRIPCSLVDELKINAGGSNVFVPRSVFMDLSDLRKASLEKIDNNMRLTFLGGDASESYVVKIDFTVSRVKHRALWSNLSSECPLQETTYFERPVQD
jgi:hypothetical protein